MAEAQQEQPQAHQPQPEPVVAAVEELAHALPHQSRAQSSLSEVTQEQATIQQGAQGQVRVEPHVTTPRGPDANGFDHIRARTPNLQAANNATTGVAAVAHAQEKERAQDQGERQGHQSSHSFSSNHSTNHVVNPTSTSSTSSPATVSITATVAAADHATLSSATAAAATTNGVPLDDHDHQQKQVIAPSPTEAMSNNPPHHPQGPPRQPTNYTNPAAYATPGMSGAHYGYANPTGQGPDAYRASAGVPNSAMALPSMRTFDPAQQQAQQQQHMAMAMPVNPVPPVPSLSAQQHMGYFGQQPVPMATNNPYALSPEALRPQYALPPSGPGSVLGGRHKKEIKRRTKTGCLTCRKRRIKCDEQHPICKNCQKSKRECLGYDPIFKNQQQHHPTNIRPAPNSNTSASVPVQSPNQPPTSSAPISGTPQTETSYSTLPPVISNTATPPSPATTPYSAGTLAAVGTAASTIKGEPLEYSTTLDPTLDTSVLSTSSMSTSPFAAIKPIIPHPIYHHSPNTPHLRGGGPPSDPLHSSVSHSAPYSSYQQTPAYTGFPARKMKVHELVGMSGAVPPALDSPLTSEKLAEVRDLYDQVYAPGLEKFFETDWYTKPQGIGALVSNAAVNEMLAGFLQSMAKTDPNDVAGMQYSANLEFRVVWDLAALVYTSDYKVNVGDYLPSSDDGSEARNRVVVFEALLSGDYLERNLLHPPPANADIRLHRNREFKFWFLLAEFLRLIDQPSLDIASQREYILGQMRELLDGRENRDVLYSLAVIRALGPNFPPDFESTLPPHLDESDPKNKLAVARKFIQDESQVTGGTTNVVRRFAELAVRAFVVPGNNIIRR
ncbi:hypothetical protein GGR54DRAFT_632720 [Hypoxylon sp. NC1633]|nr:hypothetical protein GGR54DRAFT_632720 [Hypoxylon sp. NC1633]